MLVQHFDPPAELFTRWGIDLFSPPGSVLPVFLVRGIDLLLPPDRFRGDQIPRDTGNAFINL